ncbi:MAG TPA: hypothetical protein PKC28_14850, partial [Bdellovibrionales bacterium]|nr:hypothetical protein [Bdellovibrionales bacterium]
MAKNLEFFLVALPGLEDLVARELSEWFPDIESKTEHGGVTVSVPMNIGLAMNLCLKTPTRVLMRVDRFRCRDFPKLYNKVLHFDWSDWLEPDSELDVEVATRLSRVKIKSRIVDTVLDAWMDRARENAVTFKRGKKATLFVRFHEDECTLSLDTSGERLHKRGLREFVGEAPLRETIAAALIQWVGELDPEAKDVEVIDPMMGAGTFLLEAAVRDRLVDRREFAFGAFPANSLN